MIKSMTGYGRALADVGGKNILVEIRSVNHRYFEFSSRVPRAYGYLEEKLKSGLNNKISRGKVEVCVSIYNTNGVEEQIAINESVAKGYVDALKKANVALNLNDDLSLSHLLRISDVFTVTKEIDDEDDIWNIVNPVFNEAINKFIDMREVEGSKMFDDVMGRLDYIDKNIEFIEKQSPDTTKNYREKLYTKLKELLADNNIDEQRILTEAAIFSEKTAVDEETVRLRSHINQFRDLMKSDEAIGRKLDFLVQEFNREVNTIGSKAQDLAITKIVVDLKSEIEKIREQIQNIE